MMDDNYLQLAHHYQDANQPDKALQILENHPQSIENEANLEHFLLQNVALFMLGRFDEASELSDQILHKHPQNEQVIHNWVWVNMYHVPRAEQAYQTAKAMIAEYPEHSFYYYAIAFMCFTYHIGNNEEMLASIETALKAESDHDTLYLAYQIFQHLKRTEEQQLYLSRLVAEYPDNEITQQVLAEDLFKRKKYRESIQVALGAIRSYPENPVLLELLRKSEKKLFASNFGLNPAEWVVQMAGLIERRKIRLGVWARFEQIGLRLWLYLAWLLATVMTIILAPFSLAEEIFNNERMLRKRSQDPDFGKLNAGTDTVLDCFDGVLLWNPKAKTDHQFIQLTHEGIVLAQRVLAPIDQFQYEMDLKLLKKPKVIPHKKIGYIKFSGTEMIIEYKFSGKKVPIELSSHSSMEYLQEYIESVGYESTKTKQRTRLSSLGWVYLLSMVPLIIHNVFPQKGWFLIYIQMVLVFNITYFLIYRMIFPRKFITYQRADN